MTQLPLTLEASEERGRFCDPAPDSSPETTEVVQKANPHVCRNCKVPLTGRQKAFCGKLCNSRWYDSQHPRVNPPKPIAREGTILHAILALMASGQWYTAHEIAEAVRAFPHSVSARLSELRKRGYLIEADASNGNSRRAHRFRLVASA